MAALRRPGLLLLALAWAAAATRVQQELRFGDARQVRLPAPPASALRKVAAVLPTELAEQAMDLAPFRYQVATITANGTIAIWRRAGGPRLLRPRGGARAVGVLFFPLGDRALTWSYDGAATVWNVATGAEVLEWKSGGGWAIRSTRVFPDGGRVVVCAASNVCAVWDAASGRELAAFYDAGVDSVEVFPSGERLLTWGRGASPTIWRAAGGERLCQPRGHWAEVTSASVFPRGDLAITGSMDGCAILWNASSCERVRRILLGEPVRSVAVLKGGEAVAVIGFGGTTTIWDAASGALVRRFTGSAACHAEHFREIVAFPNSDVLATLGQTSTIIWNARTGAELHRKCHSPRYAGGFALAPGGDVVAMCTGDGVTVWDAGGGAELHTPVERGAEPACLVALGLVGALDPQGFGGGLSWRELW